jgi:2-polyprenyl-6-methoxyphenol hydroxylase-like FAD-dependent oxidoreductase
MRILVSGASIAGPAVAYWLTRHGYSVTVVERAPSLGRTGGHAVDLFRPAMHITEQMGVLPRVEELATRTHRMTVCAEGSRRPVHADLTKIFHATSDRHLEIMRDDLSEIYYDATRDDVEYVFGDSITAIPPTARCGSRPPRPAASILSSAPTDCTPPCAASSSARSHASAPSPGPTWAC